MTFETLNRIHLFEFCESRFCPEFLRESVVEILGETLKQGNIYDSVTPIFRDFCDRNNFTSIIDIGSGTGKPVSILIDGLKRHGWEPPEFYLSDLFPNKHCMSRVAEQYPQHVKVIDVPTDATDIPVDIPHQARTIITVFHHFQPEIAYRILLDCVNKRKGIFIVEPFQRNVFQLLALGIHHGIIPLLENPFTTEKNSLLKGIFTYAFPLIPLIQAWDGVISALRMYTENDLTKIVTPFKDYEWKYHRLPIPFSGVVTVFTGVPI